MFTPSSDRMRAYYQASLSKEKYYNQLRQQNNVQQYLLRENNSQGQKVAQGKRGV